MDYSLVRRKIDSLNLIKHEIIRNEFSTETIVPDSRDDMLRVLYSNVSVLIHKKDAYSGKIIISGEALVEIIYQTECEDNIDTLLITVPYLFDVDTEDEGVLYPIVQVNNTNCIFHLKNSRKLDVTLELVADIFAFSTCELDYYNLEEDNNNLFVKQEKTLLEYASCVQEKEFVVEEELVMPSNKAKPERILVTNADISLIDLQSIGGRLILKGSIVLNVIYKAQLIDYPEFADFVIPFSTLMDLPEDEIHGYDVQFLLTDKYVELITGKDGVKAINIELHASAQALFSSKQYVEGINDAYCINGRLSSSSFKNEAISKYNMPVINSMVSGTISIANGVKRVLGSNVYHSIIQKNGDEFETFITVTILYLDDDECVRSVNGTFPLKINTNDVIPESIIISFGNAVIIPSSREIEVRIPTNALPVVVNTSTFTGLSEICCDINEITEKIPSVILIRANNNDLWEIAKRFRSDIETIRKYNKIDENQNITDKMLLIPTLHFNNTIIN